jgi:hypothetical protein
MKLLTTRVSDFVCKFIDVSVVLSELKSDLIGNAD